MNKITSERLMENKKRASAPRTEEQMKRIDTSHAEFMECADRLRAASMGVQASAWADMREGVHKLEKAAALLDVCANSNRELHAENTRLRAELEAAKGELAEAHRYIYGD